MKKNYLAPILVFGFFACKKNTDSVSNPQVDVYVAGADSTGGSDYGIATYWKNGKPVSLTRISDDGIGPVGAAATSIAVSAADVYVTGYQKFCGPYRCGDLGMLWKNGISVNFFSPPYNFSSLTVSNDDVYKVESGRLTGTGETAAYLKNLDEIELPDGSAGSIATAIAVSGKDVYVAGIGITGNIYSGSQNHMAKYWKNGNATNLTDGTKSAQARSIAVSGTDAYVAGREFNGNPYYDGSVGQTRPCGIANYWKNNSSINLTDGSTDAIATSIAVSGTDVYVAGTEWNGQSYQIQGSAYTYRKSVAKYWKNGNVANLSDGTEFAEARSIAVVGNDVYVAGTVNGYATYWKNGVAVKLSNVESEANSILLVKH